MEKKTMSDPDPILRYADAFLRYNEKPVELDPWQETFLKDRHQFIILLKGRQEGFSFAVAAKKFIEIQQKEVVNHTVQFVSYNLMDAVDNIRYISMMAHGIPEKRRKKIAFETKTSIEFLDSNGRTTSRLVSIACRPPRGKPGAIRPRCTQQKLTKFCATHTTSLSVTGRISFTTWCEFIRVSGTILKSRRTLPRLKCKSMKS
jgi:hypothetical protein